MMWILLGVVFFSGAIGGVINALLSDNGFVLPRPETAGETRIVRPGFLGNALIGGTAAAVSWGLYGPFAAVSMIGGATVQGAGITLSALAGAILVGIAGARWLTNEVDKNLLRAAGSQAAVATSTRDLRLAFATASPARAFHAAMAASHDDPGLPDIELPGGKGRSI